VEVWNHLADFFQDNQNAWDVTIDKEFSNTSMEDFPNVYAYCQRLKMLYDQLRRLSCQQSSSSPSDDIWSLWSLTHCCHFDSPDQPSYCILLGLFHAHASTCSHAAMLTTQPRDSKHTSQRGNCHPDNRSISRGNKGHGGGRGNRNAPQFGAPSAPSPWSSLPWSNNNSTCNTPFPKNRNLIDKSE